MPFFKILYFCFLILSFYSCSTKEKKSPTVQKKESIVISKNTEKEAGHHKIEKETIEKNKVEDSSLNNDTTEVKISEKDLEIVFSSTNYWFEYNDSLEKLENDTINFELDLGNDVRGLNIKVETLKYDSIEVYQQYKNVISLMNDGKHCDLVNWKSHSTEWVAIKTIEANKHFQIDTFEYSIDFIPFDLNDLKIEVKNSCGEMWYDLIKEIKKIQTINEYPFGVATYKFYLKFILHNNQENIKKEKIISFSLPLGC